MEYALLIAGIAAVIVLVIVLLGGNVLSLFNETSDCVNGRDEASCPDDGDE